MRVEVPLPEAPTELVREEIRKQITALSRRPIHVAFAGDGRGVVCETAEEAPESLRQAIAATARRVERSLRHVERKTVARRAMECCQWHALQPDDGVHATGRGQVLLHADAERIFTLVEQYAGRVCAEWRPLPLRAPTLVDAAVLRRCDYFRSFPQTVTFAAHLAEDGELIDRFRRREIDQGAATPRDELAEVTACLSPALCYHVYEFRRGQSIAPPGTAYTLQGRCFRHEGGGLTTDLTRLWEFTIRELVFVGTREYVLAQRDRALARAVRSFAELDLGGEIRTASDPFFAAPDTLPKQYYQLASEGKLEFAAAMPHGAWLAIGSLNYHADFFGRAFDVACDGLPMHSVCFAFGFERVVAALIARHGAEPERWPAGVRAALRADEVTA